MTYPRIGHGFDLHRLEPGHDLIVGGVKLDHDRGCVAHSDGDVLYHAVTDAILGALGEEDIGQLFPDDHPQWLAANSSMFLSHAYVEMTKAGYAVGNLDCTVILQKPKLSPHKQTIRTNLAQWLYCDLSLINVKAKTHEEVDALGENRAIACHAVILLVPRKIFSYLEWCDLTEEQQIGHIQIMIGGHQDSHLIEAACLEFQDTDSNIVSCRPGNFHGDEWIIHAFVNANVMAQYEELSQVARFRGFRIFYLEAD